CVAVHLERPSVTADVGNDLIPSACQPMVTHLLAPQYMSCGGAREGINGLDSSTQGGSSCNTCAETRCNERWPAFPDDYAPPGATSDQNAPAGTDRQFYGKPCSPYTMRNGISSSWCFDPAAGERPA